MTALALPSRAASGPAGSPAALFAAAPAFARLGAFLALSLAVTLAAGALDSRGLQGEGIWVKPVKFQLSLTLYLLTLAFFARYMPAATRATRAWRAYTVLVCTAILAEMAWIAGAAAAGSASHFNVATPLMAALYPLMGFFAVLLTSASLVTGISVWRNRDAALPPALRLAVALGLVLTFALTVPVAGYMAQGTGHNVGTPVTGARLWPMGWSAEVGDLRVPHFFAAHAMHFIPAFGLAAVRSLPSRAAMRAVIAGSVFFVAFTAFTFWQAATGHPFLALPG